MSKDEGIICFVTNGGWIDGNTMDGFRKTLQDEFSDVYVFNLRGNQRTSGELSRKEGGKVFGSGSRTPVAITLLVKRKAHTGKATVRYHDIGDYLSREQKLDIITGFGSHQSVPWQTLEPNEHHDWINQRSGDFNAFVPFNDAPDAIFAMRSSGVKTNRDTWVYNPSRTALEGNVKRMIDRYNEQVALHSERCKAAGSDAYKMAMDLADPNPRNIKWTRELYTDLSRGKLCEFDPDGIRVAEYRPFCKQWVYFNRRLNNCVYQQPKLYPTAKHRNLAIQLTGNGASKDFSCLMGNILPDLEVISKGLCFPLYWYEPATEKAAQSGFSFDGGDADDAEAHGYVKRDGITDVALANFRKHYADASITKEAIFYYCYGVLHSPEYREQYASDLKKVLPRIPYTPDFRAFEQAGRALAALHLDYEVIEPWPVIEEAKDKGDLNDFAYYRVEKMRFASAGGREKDKSVLIFNGRITLKNIPPETHEYVVNGKSALEWVMERYEPYTDKDSGIKNDPNEWAREHDDPAYILNLVKRVIRVSVETVKIVGGLPSIQ